MQCYYSATFRLCLLSTYPNFNEKLKKKIQIVQNKCIRFCIKLEKRHHIPSKEFESINWLPVHKKVHQSINAMSFKYHYLNEAYEYVLQCRIESGSSFAKLQVPFQKNNTGQKGLSYIVPSLWNNLPGSMKKTTVLNTFKHNLEKKYLGNLAGY